MIAGATVNVTGGRIEINDGGGTTPNVGLVLTGDTNARVALGVIVLFNVGDIGFGLGNAIGDTV